MKKITILTIIALGWSAVGFAVSCNAEDFARFSQEDIARFQVPIPPPPTVKSPENSDLPQKNAKQAFLKFPELALDSSTKVREFTVNGKYYKIAKVEYGNIAVSNGKKSEVITHKKGYCLRTVKEAVRAYIHLGLIQPITDTGVFSAEDALTASDNAAHSPAKVKKEDILKKLDEGSVLIVYLGDQAHGHVGFAWKSVDNKYLFFSNSKGKWKRELLHGPGNRRWESVIRGYELLFY